MYKFRYILILSFTCFISTYRLNSQTDNRAVARAGNISIDISELKTRMDLTPWPKGQPGAKDQKTALLYTLIAEKLLAQEAVKAGMDTTEEFRSAFSLIEKMYVRDALYKKEITEKIVIPASVLNEAVESNRWLIKADFIKIPSSLITIPTAGKMSSRQFDSLLSVRSGNDYKTLEIKFGDLDPALENELWSLKQGEISGTVRTEGGAFIFRIKEKTDRLKIPGAERQKIIFEAQKVLEKRAGEYLFNKFHKSFFSGKKIETDGFLFWSLSEKIILSLRNKQLRKDIEPKAKVILDFDDFKKISEDLTPDTLKMPMVKLGGENLELRHFINSLAFEGFTCPFSESSEIRAVLNSRLKLFIENELLAREAYKRGFDRLPEVRKETDIWKHNYLSQMLKNKLHDSLKTVTGISGTADSDWSGSDLVNLFEIQTDSLQVIETILNEHGENSDLKIIARKLTASGRSIISAEETGLKMTYSLGEIGRIASALKTGEIYGPIKNDRGYSVFQLLEKRKTKKNEKGFDNDSETDEKSLFLKNYYRKLSSLTASIAERGGMSINHELLESIPESGENIFSFRYMGFGGKIPSVPLTTPFTDWIEEWLKAGRELP